MRTQERKGGVTNTPYDDVFVYEKYFPRYNNDKAALASLREKFEGIRDKLETLCQQGEINEYVKCTILDMSGKVIKHLAKKYKKVRKEVTDVMVGRVLDYEAKTILQRGQKEGMAMGLSQGISQGLSQGLSQGISRGKKELLVRNVAKKMKKNLSAAEIAEMLEEDESGIISIMELLEQYGAENTDKIVSQLLENEIY